MKRLTFCLLSAFFSFILSPHLAAQIRVSGYFQSSLYSRQPLDQSQQNDFYQGLQLKLMPKKYTNLYFTGYMRFAHRGVPTEWENRYYNGYIHWQSGKNRLRLRLGRQFLYSGVMNGTMDGLLLSAAPGKNIRIKLFGGTESFKHRQDSSILGGYFSYRAFRQMKIAVSYFQKNRSNQTIWQLGGISMNGKIQSGLYYNGQFDYNFQTSSYQGMRYRLTYYVRKWSFTAEYNNQKPRIYADSYFRIFEIEAFSQFRSGVTYQINRYQLGLYLVNTLYDEDISNQLQLTAGGNWGLIGLIYKNGFGGDNAGVFGEIRYPILANLYLHLFSSYYNFQRQTLDISEDATAFSGGLEYRLKRQFRIQAEIQESINSYYKNDLRSLLRISYFFL